MELPPQENIVAVLLDSHPQSLAHLLGIPIEDASAPSLFRLMVSALLSGPRVTTEMLQRTAGMFGRRGWETPRNMAESTPAERLIALEKADYSFFDERGARASLLGEMVEALLREYNGDLRELRQRGREDTARERALIREFPGMGEYQSGVFFREVQTAWCENFPFMTAEALKGARRLSFTSDDVPRLAQIAGALNFPRLVAAFEDVERKGNVFEVLDRAVRLVK